MNAQSPEAGEVITIRAQLETVALILLQLSGTFGVGYILYLLLTYALGFQPSIALPPWARLVGLIPAAAGFALGIYTLRYRPPSEMLASTSITLMKFIRKKPGSSAGRDEPFKPDGPYQYVRNPLYFRDVALTLGVAITFSSVPLLLWDVVLVLWFWFFLIPFEESELRALFGDEYDQYRMHVPKLLPYKRGYRGPKALARK